MVGPEGGFWVTKRLGLTYDRDSTERDDERQWSEGVGGEHTQFPQQQQ